MIKKVGYFLEGHIEKIMFAVVGLMCIWLLIFRVLISPNAVSYSNEKFSPSEIDEHVLKQANELKHMLNQPPEPKPPYVSRLTGAIEPNDPVREGIWGDLQHGFDGLFASAISSINTNLYVPLPPTISSQISDGKEYALPLTDGVIGEVTDVAVEHIRAAAYVPTQPVTEDVPYENAVPQPDDLDLVTVEAKLDVAQIYRRFHESFDSDFVREEWRDPCLAVPVFAAVQLQRQELLSDGNWSDWLTVPRSKIDHRKRMFEIIENVENLPPGGIAVRLLQFNEPDVRMDLLQPPAYQIASANEEWFPPSFHRKFVDLKKKEKTEQKREEIETRKQEEEREREQRLEERRGGTFGTTRAGTGRLGGTTYEGYGGGLPRSGVPTEELRRGARGTRPRTGRGRTGQTDTGLYGDMGLYPDRGTVGRRQSARGRPGARGRDERNLEMDYMMPIEGRDIRTKPSSDDVYLDFEELLITERTDMSKMREPLLFWAHDDTLEPGKSYRYRIRLGVFNPIAGTNKFKQQSKSYRDVVILWSEFSDATEPVTLPERLYLFAKEIQEAAKMVKVQVSKYVLGYWYSEDFAVRQGEAIGKVVELERETSNEYRGLRGLSPRESSSRLSRAYPSMQDPRRLDYLRPEDRASEPESIDYSTGAVLVDAVAVDDWSGKESLRPRRYFDMLYSFDGTNIERMAISAGNWPQDLQVAFNDIRRLQRETKEPLRAWESRVGGIRSRQRAPILEGYEGLEGIYEDMIYENMMGGRRLR